MRGDYRVKVLYIAGWGRSGSTILQNVLGELDGFFPVGEIVYVWERNLIGNRLCGCGARFRECEVWQGVLERAYGGTDRIDAEEMIRRRDSGARTRHVLMMLAPWEKPLLKPRLGKYLDYLEKLYLAIKHVTGSRVIVDSSKLPSYGYVLGMMPVIDLYVVHLVRDPRAVAYSWLRRKMDPDTGELMPQYTPVQSALVWNIWNVLIEACWRGRPGRYLRLRYEDFVYKPGESIGRILDMMQEKKTDPPFVAERKVELGLLHSVGGNPSRFDARTVELRLDEEWKREMKRSDRTAVTALTWPLLRRYAYGAKTPTLDR